jgi:ubiquinone biosynthesis protein Coq4
LQREYSADNEQIVSLVKNLARYPQGSFGAASLAHYESEGFPFAGAEESEFPARYIFLHDAHHVLLGVPADHQGEMEVTAFEGGLVGATRGESILPMLSQLWGFSQCEGYEPDFVAIAKAWQLGCQITFNLLETWRIEEVLDYPLPVLRQKYGIPGDWKTAPNA